MKSPAVQRVVAAQTGDTRCRTRTLTTEMIAKNARAAAQTARDPHLHASSARLAPPTWERGLLAAGRIGRGTSRPRRVRGTASASAKAIVNFSGGNEQYLL